MVVAISALSIGAQVFAADQTKTQIKDQKKEAGRAGKLRMANLLPVV